REDEASRRPVTVDVLNRRLVSPGDLIARQPEDARHLVSFAGARGPPAEQDRQHALLVQPRLLRELLAIELMLAREVGDIPVLVHHKLLCEAPRTQSRFNQASRERERPE